jgi:putative ABC transport system substrate-binding protein
LIHEDYTVSNSNEIPTVVESMVGNVDCVYTPTDNMIAAGMATVTMVTNENKLPVICGEKGMVDAGGLATYGIDYYQLGYMTGEQAVKILTEGADISKMPIGYLDASKCELSVNEETAQTLGIDVSGLEK